MTAVLAWAALPLVLGLLSLGCGLLLEAVAGTRLPGPLLLPAGFVVISLATQFAHMSDATARLQTPFVVALAVAGYGLSPPWRRWRLDGWLAAAGVAVYAVFAAPVVLSGRATFAGYVKLDDTATYMAMLDRAIAHAYDATGLAPSTYDTLLRRTYVHGYPLGSLLPLGVGHTLLGVDALWLWQPYLTFLAVLIALGLYQLVSGLVASRMLRALVVFLGAPAALIYGYALWGGVKELFTVVVVLLVVCLVPGVTRLRHSRSVIPLAAASAAVVGGLSAGGGVWIVPPLAVGAVFLTRGRKLRETLRTYVLFAFVTGFLALPILSMSAARLAKLGRYTSSTQYGNLLGPLNWIQVFGIWPSGDFRVAPANLDPTRVLAGVVGIGIAIAGVLAWRRRRWDILVALLTVLFACLVYVERGSPWVGGKALAASSPIVLGLGLAGAAAVLESGRRVEGGIALAAIAAGVLWSNGLQYHAVLLAPSGRLTELQTIGQKFAGQGPALLTEYEPYAARHFLRTLDAEEPAELRPYPVYLRNGSEAAFGVSPDVDEIRLDQLLYYRTLVIRRTGAASRPPSAYSLVWSGRYYDVWQRPSGPSRIVEHLSLGSRLQPAAVPPCSDVRRLARVAAADHGMLAAVVRPQAIVIEANGTLGAPTTFGKYGEIPAALHRIGAYTLPLRFTAPSAGTYGVWVGGSFRSTLTVYVDGRKIGSLWNQIEWPGNLLSFGSVRLTPGSHELVLRYSGPTLSPGTSGTQPFGLGPIVIAKGTDDRKVTYVQPAAARSLCGRSLDWIEALRG